MVFLKISVSNRGGFVFLPQRMRVGILICFAFGFKLSSTIFLKVSFCYGNNLFIVAGAGQTVTNLF